MNVGIVVYIFFFLPKGKTTDIFTFFVIALILWQAEDSILRLTTSENTAIFCDRMLSVGWLSLGPLFFHFSARYAGVKMLYSRAALVVLYVPFIIFYLLYLANPQLLPVTQHESWGWVFSARPGSLDAVQRYVISLVVLAGVFILFLHAFTLRKNRRKRTKALLIAVGTFIPAAQGILTQVVFPLILNREEIPLTSTFLTFFSIAAIIALGKYRLFNVSESVEVDTVLENLTSVVIIVSPDQRVMYMNPYARRVFNINEKKDDNLHLRSIFPGAGDGYEKFCHDVLGSSVAARSVKNYAATFLSAKGEEMEVVVSTEIITNNKQVQGLLLVANDITETLKTLKELEASNERFEYVTQATFDAVWDWDLISDTLYWGKGLENLFGHSITDLQKSHTSWIENIHPEDRERVLERIQYTIRSQKKNWADEYRFRKANGEYAHVADKGLVIRKEGQPIRMIGAMQDITVSKEQVNEIFRMQQNLHSLINNTTDLIWSVDRTMKIITANKAYIRAVEHLTGKLVAEGDDVLKGVTDQDFEQRWFDMYQRALAGEAFNVEESMYNPVAGRTMHSIISFNPIVNADGNVSGVACFAKDVTRLKTSEQKQQELNVALQKRAEELAALNAERMAHLDALKTSNERYNLVSKATNDMVWDWDLETGMVYRNEEGWKKIFHTALERESGTEEDWEAMIHPDDLEKLRMTKSRICKDPEKEFFEIECRVQRKDGSYAWILDRGYLVRNSEGKPARLIGASHDITEKKRAEQQLKEEQMRRQREITDAVILAQENERRKFGAELHDNVNQILACTLLYINLAKKESPDKNFLFNKSEEMINAAILEIRKLSHELIPPALNDEDLSEALGRLIEPAQKTGLMEIDKDLQLTEEEIISEKLKLTIYRIAQEQLNNIIKYSKAKKVTIKILQEAGELLLVIKDDGVGFDTTQKSKGVGLLNMRTRAYLHHGIVRIVSSPGNGCTLYATFPLIKEVVETLPEQTQLPAEATQTSQVV